MLGCVGWDHHPPVLAGAECAAVDHLLQRRVRHIHEAFGAAATLVVARPAQDDEAASGPKLVAPVVQEGLPVSFRLPGERFLYHAGRPVGPDVVGDGGGNAAEPVDGDRVPADVDVGIGEEPLVEGFAPA